MSNRPAEGRIGISIPRRRFLAGAAATSLLAIGSILGLDRFSSSSNPGDASAAAKPDSDLRAKFDYLSTHGNSNCSTQFLNSIPNMSDDQRLQGSCCSPMAFERYAEQIEGLGNYSSISSIPTDPYDIPVSLAKQLLKYNSSIQPDPQEQAILEEAVAASAENGYCCCRCWRWSVYEGLSKYLVRDERFTVTQITDVLDNSDGCGG